MRGGAEKTDVLEKAITQPQGKRSVPDRYHSVCAVLVFFSLSHGTIDDGALRVCPRHFHKD